ncbi:MAG: N-acetylmuramoyl-L-alanine amidase [Sedimentisphaerales bacterium]|nr:N-acetylmuramoyl-L-alanine amidase [Sedimentisphaerales bacterium]
MPREPRAAKVLAALLASMTTGAIVLMALGNHPPKAGPFCLSSYYRLNPVEEAVRSRCAQAQGRWNCVEIYYSSTRAGNIEQLASLSGLAGPEDIDCHFVICNGLGGSDGQIQPTERWQRQWSTIPNQSWYGSGETIRICIVADEKQAPPTDLQIRRTQALIEGLCLKFEIEPKYIYHPKSWH